MSGSHKEAFMELWKPTDSLRLPLCAQKPPVLHTPLRALGHFGHPRRYGHYGHYGHYGIYKD